MRPVVIEVRDVEKTFRVPARSAHPFTRAASRELRALRGVSFDVGRGEFFGVVGRNGSGKSTLLKILAGIYRADAGRVRMAGRVAPFVELGVGFNMDLTARENVALNGVMMGLGRREAAHKLDSVLQFAELGQFVDLKLKNYSSGMLARLAFAVTVGADADVMLVDEVLAVGDASFAQKCMDVFRERRRAGRTLVLVTHDMGTVQGFCDRAMLMHEGELVHVGDPDETAMRYHRLNFPGADGHDRAREADVAVVDAWLEDEAGARVEEVVQGKVFAVHLVVEAQDELIDPAFGFEVLNVDGAAIFGFGKALAAQDGESVRVAAGQRVRVAAKLENPLVPGRYWLRCSISRNGAQGDVALRVPQLLELDVRRAGGRAVAIAEHEVGMVSVGEDVAAVVERQPA
jgi:ABC-type polysaccharide/polyol phosphate transport system ATPase subunit